MSRRSVSGINGLTLLLPVLQFKIIFLPVKETTGNSCLFLLQIKKKLKGKNACDFKMDLCILFSYSDAACLRLCGLEKEMGERILELYTMHHFIWSIWIGQGKGNLLYGDMFHISCLYHSIKPETGTSMMGGKLQKIPCKANFLCIKFMYLSISSDWPIIKLVIGRLPPVRPMVLNAFAAIGAFQNYS